MFAPLSFVAPQAWTARPVPARGLRYRGVLWRTLCACAVLCSLQGCLAPSVGAPVLGAGPNPSSDGTYTVFWTPVRGASRYRLYEDGVLSYEGPAHAHGYEDRPAGTYTYSLSYCVLAFDIEACRVDTGASSVRVVVTRP